MVFIPLRQEVGLRIPLDWLSPVDPLEMVDLGSACVRYIGLVQHHNANLRSQAQYGDTEVPHVRKCISANRCISA